MIYFYAVIVIIGMVISFFFLTASVFDLLLLLFPFLDRFVVLPRDQYFKILYGSPKTSCIIICILSFLYLLLFKFAYPYLQILCFNV